MKLHILDNTGHTTLEEGTMSVAEMERAFNEKKGLGYMAYADRGSEPAEVIKSFNPNEKEITMHAPLAGG